jgi:hypothetical protein
MLLNAQWSRPSFRGTGSFSFHLDQVAYLAYAAHPRSVALSSLNATVDST